MVAKHFFHPHHIVPAIEFEAALVELANQVVAHFFVEEDAVFGKVFIFDGGAGDAGVGIKDALCGKEFFQFKQEGFANSHFVVVHGYIN